MTHKIFIHIKNYTSPMFSPAAVKAAIVAVLDYYRKAITIPCEVSAVITDDEDIRAYNNEFRGEDHSTDVLSFPAHDISMEYGVFPSAELAEPSTGCCALGDILISAETVFRQTGGDKSKINAEAMFMTVHSMLHLLGYDHAEPGEKAVMRENETEIMKNLGLGDYLGNKNY
ncbi:MAG: rRNA maturation RNase YbeY [Oscillospiraceae bacterium]|jgi:probable rRNA maturation factor|nr:rRNA maturation RNase YbeY [Oscillospiraceae bacterium]